MSKLGPAAFYDHASNVAGLTIVIGVQSETGTLGGGAAHDELPSSGVLRSLT